MHVIGLVTTVATGRSTQFIARRWLGMALLALDNLVTAVQVKFRSTIMIEVPDRPIAHIVATVTFPTEPQFMLVFFLVTAIALRLGILEFCRFMAQLALGLEVLAQQGELGLAVIEADIIALPTLFIVAIFALLPLLALMFVVLLVAGIALGWRLVAESG